VYSYPLRIVSKYITDPNVNRTSSMINREMSKDMLFLIPFMIFSYILND